MEQSTYKQLLAQLEGLTPTQAQAVSERLRLRNARTEGERLINERHEAQGACPHCASPDYVRFGKSGGTQRYRCKACRKTFTALTGTPFARLRGKDQLLANAECMAEGLSVRKTAARLGMSVRKAFRWRHKFLALLSQQKPVGMTGVVETDETFFPLSYKGQRKGLPRAPKKRGGNARKPDKSDDTAAPDVQVPVLVANQRGSRITFNQVLGGLDAASMAQALRPVLTTDAVLSSDGNASYGVVAKELGIEAGYFVARHHGRGGNGVWHVQNVNAYHRRLKGWMMRFNGVATKYLPHYLAWRQLLDRFKDSLTPQQFMFHALRAEYVNA